MLIRSLIHQQVVLNSMHSSGNTFFKANLNGNGKSVPIAIPRRDKTGVEITDIEVKVPSEVIDASRRGRRDGGRLALPSEGFR